MKFGLIGKSLVHSFSKSYFNDKFQHLAAQDLSYHNCELEDISEVELLLQSRVWQGFNVTIPYKESIIPYLDGLSESALRIGAVNTIVREGESWIGYNTDYLGFKKSLEEKWPNLVCNLALVLGSGGASKGVAHALQSMAIPFKIVSRRPELHQLSYEEAIKATNFDMVINTTPLGTFPQIEEEPPFPIATNQQGKYYVDLVYNPPQTNWLRKAELAGAEILNGAGMLKWQAEFAWELWRTSF